jgi:hypothetical protein
VKQCDRTLAWRDRLMLAADPRSTLQGSAVRSAASLVHVLIRRHACRVRGRRMGHWGGGGCGQGRPPAPPVSPLPTITMVDGDGPCASTSSPHIITCRRRGIRGSLGRTATTRATLRPRVVETPVGSSSTRETIEQEIPGLPDPEEVVISSS